MAPSELLIRYVQRSSVGNRRRNARSGSAVTGARIAGSRPAASGGVSMGMRMIRLAPAVLRCLAVLCGLFAALGPTRAARAEGAVAPAEEAKKAAIENIRKDLKRWATSP